MIDIQILDEEGRKLESFPDPDILSAVLPPGSDGSTVCLRFIDSYGDTTLNRLQIPVLLEELRARVSGLSARDRLRANALINFAERATTEPHLYLKFVGD